MSKIKLNNPKQDVSSEEIKSRRNFNSVLKEYKKVSTPFYKNTYLLSAVGLAVISASLLFFLKPEKKEIEKPKEEIFQTAIKEKPFRRTAIQNLEIPFEIFSVDASRSAELKLKNGSRIKIPAQAFGDNAGKSISGKVDIHYREFRDAVDMLVSGIPMDYDSAGMHRQLESAGMFEILGTQNGKPVFLRKEIRVELASAEGAGDFNQYYLDTLAKTWKYLGRDKITVTANNENKYSKKEMVADSSMSLVPLPFDEPSDESVTTIDEVAALKKEQPVKPVRATLQNYRFDLDVLPEEFPELSEYKGLQFEIAPENKNFSEKMYSIEWDDVKLDYNTPGKNYKIGFVKDGKTSAFIVYPVYQNKDSAKVMALYHKKYIAYERKLSEKIEAEKKAEEKRIAAQKKYEEEMKVLQKKYAEEALRQSRTVSYGSIRNVFSVNNFGVYNSDHPFIYDNETPMNISFVDQQNKRLPVDIAYLIDYQRNTLFSHYYYNSADYILRYNSKSRNMLFVLSPQNKLWIFGPEAFETVKVVNGNYTFIMEKNEKIFKTVSELKEYLLPQQTVSNKK